VLIVTGPILINKDMFEPSYNVLKCNSPKPQLLFHQPNVSYEIPKWPSDNHSEKLSDLYTVRENRPSKTKVLFEHFQENTALGKKVKILF